MHVVSGDFGAFGDSKGGLQFENFAAVRAFGDVSMAPLPANNKNVTKTNKIK